MMKDMYGDLLDGDDSSGFEYTEIMGDGSDGTSSANCWGEVDGDSSGAFVGDGSGSSAWGDVLGKDDILGRWSARSGSRTPASRRWPAISWPAAWRPVRSCAPSLPATP